MFEHWEFELRTTHMWSIVWSSSGSSINTLRSKVYYDILVITSFTILIICVYIYIYFCVCVCDNVRVVTWVPLGFGLFKALQG